MHREFHAFLIMDALFWTPPLSPGGYLPDPFEINNQFPFKSFSFGIADENLH